jgi:predicted transcriptional regulator
MGILEKEVWVVLSGANQKRYEELGYIIPRYKDSRGKISIKRGTEILVKVSDLSNKSKSIVTVLCDECKINTKKVKYSEVTRSRDRNGGVDRCRSCSSKKTQDLRSKEVVHENTLQQYAIREGKEYLIREFSKDNNLQVTEIGFSSNKYFKWKCGICDSEYKAKLNNRTAGGCNCPYCSNTKVNNTNSLWTTDPEVASLLVDSEIGHKVTRGSGKKVNFKCPICESAYPKYIKNVVNFGIGCVNCADGFSYPEKIMISVLDQLSIDFETQKSFSWSENKRYDFFIESLNCIIETHGLQHYKDSYHRLGRFLEQDLRNDKLKEVLAKMNNIDKYIVINCSKSDVMYIKNNILSSKLKVLLNLNEIDWKVADSFANYTRVKEVCSIWDSTTLSNGEIAEMLDLDKSTVSRYLKKGAEIGICNYEKGLSTKRVKTFGEYKKRSVIQIDLDGNIITTWESISDACKYNQVYSGNVSKVCKGELRQTGGYVWKYR